MAMSDSFATRLLQWYDQHGRQNLPWHRDRSPYRVWVSEIMLQQTQVATVIPYFNQFMVRFPDVHELARAERSEVLSHWSGLGYYARARNLHNAAVEIVEHYGGTFPSDPDTLQTLPGIGRSTAAAIAAQAFDVPAAILDGNAKRVLARYHAVGGWPGRAPVLNKLWEHAEAHTPRERVRDYTQAIMDLGSLLCTRRRPGCAACPVSSDCAAYARNNPEAYPASKPKKEKPQRSTWMLLVEDHAGRLLFEERPPSGIWGGLLSLPEADPALQPEEVPDYCTTRLGLEVESPQALEVFRHTFSHYHLDIHPLRLSAGRQTTVADDQRYRWLSREEAQLEGLPAPIRRLIT